MHMSIIVSVFEKFSLKENQFTINSDSSHNSASIVKSDSSDGSHSSHSIDNSDMIAIYFKAIITVVSILTENTVGAEVQYMISQNQCVSK